MIQHEKIKTAKFARVFFNGKEPKVGDFVYVVGRYTERGPAVISEITEINPSCVDNTVVQYKGIVEFVNNISDRGDPKYQVMEK